MAKMNLDGNNDISVAGLFVGCGGLDFGFKMAGTNLVWANEIDKDSSASYELLVGHKVFVGDIQTLQEKIPKVDVVIGGPPCQSFSLVGKRIQDDPRGQLVFAFLRTIETIRPKVFVMENVPGLLASYIDGIRLPDYLAASFTKLGYTVQIEKLNATDYFVPQKRKRVVLIGRLSKTKPFVFPSDNILRSKLNSPKLVKPVSVSESLDDLPNPKGILKNTAAPYSTPPHSAYSSLMRASNGKTVTLQHMPTMSKLDAEFIKYIPPGGNYMNIPDDISTKRILKFKISGGRTTTYGRLHPDQPAYTINTYFNRPNVGANYHHKENRLITIREAMRLQSFPDWFTPHYTNQRSLHQQIGNAVPPLMAFAIALGVIESLKK